MRLHMESGVCVCLYPLLTVIILMLIIIIFCVVFGYICEKSSACLPHKGGCQEQLMKGHTWPCAKYTVGPR